jgi:hypothetical protein
MGTPSLDADYAWEGRLGTFISVKVQGCADILPLCSHFMDRKDSSSCDTRVCIKDARSVLGFVMNEGSKAPVKSLV